VFKAQKTQDINSVITPWPLQTAKHIVHLVPNVHF